MEKLKPLKIIDIIAIVTMSFAFCGMIIADRLDIHLWQFSLAKTIRDIGFFISGGLLIPRGIWMLRKYGLKRNVILILLCGFIMFAIPICSHIIIYNLAATTLESDKNRREHDGLIINDLKLKLNSDTISTQKKSEISKVLAKRVYFYDGININYVDSVGNLIKHIPTTDEMQSREEMINSTIELDKTRVLLYHGAIQWTCAFLICVLIGFIISFKTNKEESK